MTKQRHFWLVLLMTTFSLNGFGLHSRSDSAATQLVDVTIKDAHLISQSKETEQIQREIKKQMQFMIGQLNGIDGGAAIDLSLEIEIQSTIPLSSGTYETTYQAKFLAGWSRKFAIPATYPGFLPEGGDRTRLNQFYQSYGPGCGGENHGADAFFFYFNPRLGSCPLRPHLKSPNAETVELHLAPSDTATTGKSPDYESLWKDGELIATVVFGNTDSRSAPYDLYQSLRSEYGSPQTYQYKNQGDFDLLSASFHTARGTIDLAAFFLSQGNIASPSSNFQSKFNERRANSDFLSYNGHSGLGRNVQAFSRLGKIPKGQYQIFHFHGCDTFSYLDPYLFEGYEAANPGSAPQRFIDIIATVTVGSFNYMPRYNFQWIRSLTQGQKTYRDILSTMPVGSPAVLGEGANP